MKKWLTPALQTGFIALLVLSFYATSWFGEQYVLRAEPYDPFDPFYGEYVMLQYPDLVAPSGISDGEVHFTLKQGDDGFAIIDRISEQPFFGAIGGTKYSGRITAPQLDNFYVEQGQGPELERQFDLQAIVDVAPWGSIRPGSLEMREP